MHDDWRMREYVNQSLLYVAFRARDAIIKRPVDEFPIDEPLTLSTVTVTVKNKSQAMCDALKHDPRDVEPVQKLMNQVRAMARNPQVASKIENAQDWSISTVLTWWIQAGVAIAEWRPSVYRRGASIAPDQPEPRLLDAALNALLLDDDEEWPPVWCAEHSRSWKLAGHLAADRPAAWNRPGSRDDYRRHLLDWCGNPRREGMPSPEPLDEAEAKRWARDYQARYRDFARAAVRLVREGCRFGHIRDAAGPGGPWQTYREPRLPATMFEALRRPLHLRNDQDAPPIAAGWLVVPSPAALLADVRNTTITNGSSSSTVERAVGRAVAAWPASERAFGSLRSLKSAEGDATGRARRLAALASLLVAVDSSPASDGESRESIDILPRYPMARLRLALALEGITAVREPHAGGGSLRLIPANGVPASPGREATARLVLVGRDERIEVGVVGEPSRCPESLLAAIEEVDWCHWALQTCGGSKAAAHLTSANWEACKRRLLLAAPDAPATRDELVQAFEHLHPVRLAIDPLRTERSDAELLGDALAGLERAICGLLVTTDSGVAATLHPPRTSDAYVSLMAWLAAPAADDPRAARWDVAWERSPASFGTVIREEPRTGDQFRVVISAGELATDADLRLFCAPGVIHRPAGPWNRIAGPITAGLRAAVPETAPPDTSAVIGQIKAALAGAQADAFDELVHRAIAGDARAIGWIRMMQMDPRFDFACHPAIDTHEHGVSRLDAGIGDGTLEWRDADAPVDEEMEVWFARDASRARRVLSRGRPNATSAEAIAARLVHAVQTGSDDLLTAARGIQQATDLRRKFGEPAADPIAAVLAAGDALVKAGEGLGAAASQAIDELAAWCRAIGCKLVPERWHPTHGAAADGLDVTRVDFHPTVPAGNVVVERFGILRADATAAALQALVSAGPTPKGFIDVVKLAQAIAGDHEEITRFRRCIADFASRTLKGQGSAAAASLFDVTWKAAMAAPDDAALDAAAKAVHDFLKDSCGMIAFKPESLTQYPEAWLRNRENGPARGLRVDRVVRPGLRKLDNSLIYPAIVETG
jgi:hypothetical protein